VCKRIVVDVGWRNRVLVVSEAQNLRRSPPPRHHQRDVFGEEKKAYGLLADENSQPKMSMMMQKRFGGCGRRVVVELSSVSEKLSRDDE
jgi:hypothetical protein